MRRYLLTFLIALCLGALLFQFLISHSSYLMLVVGSTSVEMSLWLALLLTIAGLALLWVVLRFFGVSFRVVSGSAGFFGRQKVVKARKQTTLGLIDYIEGNWQRSRAKLVDSAELADEPLINYLAAANCSRELDDRERAFDLLNTAEDMSKRAILPVALERARFFIKDQCFDEALSALAPAAKTSPNHPVVLRLQYEACLGASQWDDLLKLMPAITRQCILPKEQSNQAYELIYTRKIGALAQDQANLESLHGLWNREIPTVWRKNGNLQLVYVDALIGFGEHREAAAMISDCMASHWDSRLVDRYGRIQLKDTLSQLSSAEAWLEGHEEDADVLLCLARLSMLNELWGKARDYLARAVELSPSEEVFAEYARLMSHLGEHRRSAELYARAAGRVVTALPDLPMPVDL